MSSNCVSFTQKLKKQIHNEKIFSFVAIYISGTELSDAKEKLSRVESSSSDSEDEGTNKRKKIEVGERPSEEMVEKMEEKLEAANLDQKRLFLIVFQRFIMILSEHLVNCDTNGQDFDTDWYRWTIGRLQQVFLLVSSVSKNRINQIKTILKINILMEIISLQHHEQVQKYSGTLETLLFSSDVDTHILDVFQQYISLRA